MVRPRWQRVFPLKDRDNEFLLIWTTTPWTLTSNVGAAVNTDLDYVKLKANKDDAVYYFAKDNLNFQRLATEFKDGFGRPEWKWPDGVGKLKTIAQIFKEQGGFEERGTVKGADLVGWAYEGPFDDLPAQQLDGGYPVDENNPGVNGANWHKVIDGGRDSRGAAHVVAGEGTGIVHMAPGCGDVDHKIGSSIGMPIIAPLKEDGTYGDAFGDFSGKEAIAPETAEMVIEKLKENITTGQDWLRDRPWRKWQALNQTKYTARWAEAIAAIRKHPKYEKLDLAPQEGLVPLGPDPKSGLWEFAHLPSGNPPVRGGDRKWKISGQTCIVLVLVPGGKFRMGAVATATQAVADEKPAHDVTLAAFFISKYELTQGQWVRLAGKNTSKFAAGKTIAGRAISRANPVEKVTWFECRRLLARTGLVLPTEAQWEYSARAGTRTVWWTGNTTAGLAAAGNVVDASMKRATRGKMAGESWDDGHAVHAPVGSFLPNAFGLYDVIGNVYEWCRDPFHDRAYDLKPHSGEEGWRNYPDDASMRARVNRGGGWTAPAFSARSSFRDRDAPSARNNSLGSRAARGIH